MTRLHTSRIHTLLLELLLTLLFFSISAAVILQVFAGAREIGVRSERQTRAMLLAQTTAERLMAADDLPAFLAASLRREEDGSFTSEEDGYGLTVSLRTEPTAAGTLYSFDITVYQAEALASLASARYVPLAEESP